MFFKILNNTFIEKIFTYLNIFTRWFIYGILEYKCQKNVFTFVIPLMSN